MAPRQIAIFTEGSKTEPAYFNYWYRAYRDRINVIIYDGLGAPMTVVKKAVEQKRHEAREARRRRGKASDEYWCVFDVDQHPNVSHAIDRALANGIDVSVSNPCIELWFILHFQTQTAHIERHDAQSASRGHLNCGKVLTEAALNELIERFPKAKERALALDSKHLGDGRKKGSNPSSEIWRLIDQMKG